jgi:transcriptional regulator with XRE-family HTH domain
LDGSAAELETWMSSHLQVVTRAPSPEASTLGAARVRRRLTLEEAAARTGLDPEELRALEEGRIYRFPSVDDALAATLVYATALGIDEREARKAAGLRRRRGWSLDRWLAALGFAAAAVLLGWFVAVPQLRDAIPTGGGPSASAEAHKALPPPWEIRVDVYNGTSIPNAATRFANQIGGPLAYQLGSVDNASRLDYVQTRVYYPPGSEDIAERLAKQLGVETTALPGGKNPKRLVVIVGTDAAG